MSAAKSTTATNNRRPLYAKIAIARKQLPGMDDDDVYRDLVEAHFQTRSASDLSFQQLSRLVNILVDKGAIFISKVTRKQEGKGKEQKPARAAMRTAPHARSDFYHIADDEFGPIKRKVAAIWKGLGYDMTSLDTRCKREFGVESFAWLRDRQQLKRLVLDLEQRERAHHADAWDKATVTERD